MASNPVTDVTPEKREKFLNKLREIPNVSRACRLAKVSRMTVYRLKESDPDFAAAWADALEEGIETLEAKAFERAKRDSDTLMIFLLKAHKPQIYRDRLALTDGEGGPLKIQWVDPISPDDEVGVGADQLPDSDQTA